MSKETAQWLNTMTLIGYTEKRGNAWHYRADAQGAESNHYRGAIPKDDVRRRLFNWEPVEGTVYSEYMTAGDDGLPTTVRIEDEDRKAIIRPAGVLGDRDPGAMLGLFKSGYRVHGYSAWLIGNVETIVDGDLSISSAGLLKGGAVGWVEISIADTLETNGVLYRPNLLAATSMDGSLATTYQRTIQATVCDNTLSANLGDGGERIKVKHSRNSLNKISDVRDALGIVYETADSFSKQVKELCDRTVTDAQWREFLNAYVPLPKEEGRGLTQAENKRGELTRLWKNDNRAAPWKNTAYGVVAAVNTYVHHYQTVRGASRPERNMLRAVTGGADDLDRETLDTLDKVLVHS